MKKFRLSFLLLSLLLIAVGARADEITVNDGEATNSNVPIYGYWADSYNRSQFIIPAENLAEMSKNYITKMKFYATANASWGNAKFNVYLSEVKEEAFDAEAIAAYDWETLSLVYSGSLSVVDGVMTVEFDEPYQYAGGNLLVAFSQTEKGTWASVTWRGKAATAAAISGYNGSSPEEISFTLRDFLPKTTFEYSATVNTCKKPTNLTVSGMTTSGAILSWTSDANKWDISYTNLVNGNQGIFEYEGEPSFFFNAPTPGDVFRVRIRAVCDANNKSDWSNEIILASEACEEVDKCAITYELTDGLGYGWLGSHLDVVDHLSGSVIATLKYDAATTGIIPVCPGQQIDFVFVSGGSGYDSYIIGYKIYDVSGEVITSHTAGNSISAGVKATYLVDCNVETDCLTPTDFAASNITAHSATLSWTEKGTSTSWMIMYMASTDQEVSLAEANENPFILTGLAPETTYYALVYPTCDENKMSDAIMFTTPAACLIPEDVEVTPVATTAEIAWTGYSDSYIVRYRPPVTPTYFQDFENGAGEWTTVDNDGDGNNWGIVLNGDPDGNGNPRGFDNYHATSASYINNTGALTPDNWLISPELDLEGTMSVWLRGQDPSWPAEHFAIYVSTEGKEVANFLASESNVLIPETEATGVLTEYTADLSGFKGQKGYIAIRHFNCTDQFMLNVDNFAIYNGITHNEWTTVTTDEESIELTGLTPDTNYEYQIEGVCEEANSKVVEGTFTTLEGCPVPFNITVTPDITEATATWKGESESYNVRYRIPEQTETVFLEDFENGMEGWTAIRNGEGTENTDWRVINSYTAFSNGPIPAHSGNYVAMSRSYSGSGYHVDNWLISPEVTLDGTLNFWVLDDGSWHEYFEVYVSTTGKEIADFGTEAFYKPSYATNVWQEVTVDLSEFKGQKGYIAIRHTDYDQDYLFIDDFEINLKTAEATEWQELTTDEAAVELTGLEPGTDYEIQVQGVCDKVPTEWSNSVIFTTLSALVLLDDDLAQPEGAKNTDIITANQGKPANVVLKDRVFYKDGNWNTLCLPFNLTEEQIAESPLAGATICGLYYANVEGTHVDIQFTPATEITSDWVYIFKWEEQGENIVDPVFNGVTIDYSNPEGPMLYTSDYSFFVLGNYSTVVANPAEDDVYAYYLGADNKLRYSTETVNLHTFRIYFNFFKNDVDPSTIEFNLNFDGEETTGIVEVDGARKANAHEGTYNLQGVKINQPKQKGVYISNGRKVVIK